MSSILKPIETRFDGFRFRSRLEARWAIFFKRLGLEYEYEPEGFDLGYGELYLPDFRVSSSKGFDHWYEVKRVGVESDRKFQAFKSKCRDREGVGHVRLIAGDPFQVLNDGRTVMCPRCGGLGSIERYSEPTYNDPFFLCWPCDRHTPGGGGHPSEMGVLGLSVTPDKGSVLISHHDLKFFDNQVAEAANAARSARFEHGESAVG
jgi:hypothetical protein